MKRYNRGSGYKVILGIILPILAFFVSMYGTYAYFTASTTQDSSKVSLGALKIRFSGDTSFTLNSQTITGSMTAFPGQQFKATAEIENSGDSQVFAIISFKLTVTKSDLTTESPFNSFYTMTSDSNILIPIIENADGSYSQNAFVIDKSAKKSFTFIYDFDFYQYGNEYKNARVAYELKAYAIQSANFNTAKDATIALMEVFNLD